MTRANTEFAFHIKSVTGSTLSPQSWTTLGSPRRGIRTAPALAPYCKTLVLAYLTLPVTHLPLFGYHRGECAGMVFRASPMVTEDRDSVTVRTAVRQKRTGWVKTLGRALDGQSLRNLPLIAVGSVWGFGGGETTSPVRWGLPL